MDSLRFVNVPAPAMAAALFYKLQSKMFMRWLKVVMAVSIHTLMFFVAQNAEQKRIWNHPMLVNCFHP